MLKIYNLLPTLSVQYFLVDVRVPFIGGGLGSVGSSAMHLRFKVAFLSYNN